MRQLPTKFHDQNSAKTQRARQEADEGAQRERPHREVKWFAVFPPYIFQGRPDHEDENETNRILSDDELLAVSGGRCPITNGDDPRFKLTM
jgi:hypothetical protein